MINDIQTRAAKPLSRSNSRVSVDAIDFYWREVVARAGEVVTRRHTTSDTRNRFWNSSIHSLIIVIRFSGISDATRHFSGIISIILNYWSHQQEAEQKFMQCFIRRKRFVLVFVPSINRRDQRWSSISKPFVLNKESRNFLSAAFHRESCYRSSPAVKNIFIHSAYLISLSPVFPLYFLKCKFHCFIKII